MSNLQRKENETALNYLKRIIYGKLVDKTIDVEYEDLSELIFGEGNCFNSSEVRKRFYGIKRALDLLEDENISNISDDEILKELELKQIELQKEKQRFFDQRTAYNKMIRDSARLDELKNIIKNTIETIEPYKDEYKVNIVESENDLLIGLNDIHFGADFENYWNKYNSDIAKLRLDKYLFEIIKIQKLHNSENAYVLANGDLISGNIHMKISLINKENVVEQIMGVSELISWFLSELSKYFKKVNFVAVAGNHSRLALKDLSPKDERLDDLIPFYIKARLQNIKNIEVIDNDIDNTMYLVNIRGLNYLGVHGDYDSIGNLLKLVEMLPHKIYAIFMGHLHHNKADYIQGYKVLMSGSLIGLDDYCIEKRIKGLAQQIVCICTDKGAECVYDVDLQ